MNFAWFCARIIRRFPAHIRMTVEEQDAVQFYHLAGRRAPYVRQLANEIAWRAASKVEFDQIMNANERHRRIEAAAEAFAA